MVGFGYAMTANLPRHIGDVVTWGYPALDSALIAERSVHSLDHRLCTIIFGAGQGLFEYNQPQEVPGLGNEGIGFGDQQVAIKRIIDRMYPVRT